MNLEPQHLSRLVGKIEEFVWIHMLTHPLRSCVPKFIHFKSRKQLVDRHNPTLTSTISLRL